MKEGKIRFNIIFVSDEVPSDSGIEELKYWSEIFEKRGLTPEFEGNYTGNMSFRSKEGFIITSSGLKSKENLTNDCFVTVKSYEEKSNTVYVEGKRQPSSEAVMHFLIYKALEEINRVLKPNGFLIIEALNKNYPKWKLFLTKIHMVINEASSNVIRYHLDTYKIAYTSLQIRDFIDSSGFEITKKDINKKDWKFLIIAKKI